MRALLYVHVCVCVWARTQISGRPGTFNYTFDRKKVGESAAENCRDYMQKYDPEGKTGRG